MVEETCRDRISKERPGTVEEFCDATSEELPVEVSAVVLDVDWASMDDV